MKYQTCVLQCLSGLCRKYIYAFLRETLKQVADFFWKVGERQVTRGVPHEDGQSPSMSPTPESLSSSYGVIF